MGAQSVSMQVSLNPRLNRTPKAPFVCVYIYIYKCDIYMCVCVCAHVSL